MVRQPSPHVTQAFRQARAVLLRRQAFPYFATGLLRLTPVEADDVAYAAVDAELRLYIGPRFSELPLEERAGVLLHEFEHVRREHHARRGGRDPEIWNIATDLEINSWLVSLGMPAIALPAGVLLPERFGLPDRQTAETYYAMLQQRGEGRSGGHSADSGSGADGVRRPREAEADAQGIRGTPTGRQAGIWREVREAARAAGPAVPPEIREWATSTHDRPLFSRWEILADLARLADTRITWRNRRQEAYRPIVIPTERDNPDALIVLIVDVSGSMADLAGQLAATLLTASRALDARLVGIACDTDVRAQTVIRSARDVEALLRTGWGGTDLNPALVRAAQLRPAVAVLITDGVIAAPWVGRQDYPLLAIIVGDGDAPPWAAKVVRVRGG